MYAACGALEKAHEVFDELSFRTVVSWNALITGYVREGLIDKTFECLEKMRMEGFVPNEVTFVCALNACGIAGNIQKGQELHAEIVKYGLLQEATTLGTVLLNMYANCCMLKEAEEVFDNFLTRDVIAWTALIAGYTQHGYANEALNCYELMQSEGCSPNAFTYSCILKACGSLGALDRGQQIHAKVLQEGLLSGDHVITNSLVDMYAKCGLLDKAHTLFDRLEILDAVSWTALITGYTKYGFAEEALSSFKEMCHKGFSPDAVTFACILKACSIIGAVHQCQEIHVEIIKDGTLLTNKPVYTALVETYASCGMLREAQEVFDSMLTRDVVVWTALMEGYAHLGEVDIVFDLLYKMEGDGIKPNMITLTVVLNSCAHNGLLKEGEKFFMMMNEGFDMLPTLEHHTCMVDLYGRAGHLDKAGAILEEMPYFASPTVWHTLLCACRGNFNRDLGAWAANHACQADMKDPSVYVCLSNMYVISGRHVRKEPYDV
ncbi:hypothetical protein KP509_26G014700 [Ceratopteris richardii]|nr:hypothetical protein KP509_26G014700 [Ceratopteris richardii]